MDKSIVVMEEIERGTDNSRVSGSKSIGPMVRINSMIDLNSAMEEVESPDVHEHFSIRGFVAGMRKNDAKICSLFASKDGGDDELPPLFAPKFQWWQCLDCVPTSTEEQTTTEVLMLQDKSDIRGGEQTSRDTLNEGKHDPGCRETTDVRNSEVGNSSAEATQPNQHDASDTAHVVDRPPKKCLLGDGQSSCRLARIPDLNEKPFMTPDLNENEEQNDPSPSPSFSPRSHPKNFHLLFNSVLCRGESSKSSTTQGQMAPPQARNTKYDGPSNLSIQPSSTNVALDVCSLNSNPADFGVPDPNNEFTICYRDLKLRKRKTMKARNDGVNLDDKKRKRGRKDGSN